MGLLGPLTHIDLSIYKHYLVGKTTRNPFGEPTRAELSLPLIHSDIYDPLSVMARHGAHYVITFIDDFTYFGVIYLISHRYETLDYFRHFQYKTENQLNTKIKALKIDRGQENLSDQFREMCEEK